MASIAMEMTPIKEEAKFETELAQFQDICNSQDSISPLDEQPSKSAILEYEQLCDKAVQEKLAALERADEELSAKTESYLQAQRVLVDCKAALEMTETEEINTNNELVESNANLARCHAELAQAELEHNASQSLVVAISTRNRGGGGGGDISGSGGGAIPASHSPYLIARKNRLGIMMLSERFFRGAPSGDVHKAFMSDLKEYLYENEGRELITRQIHGCTVDYYRFIAEVLQAGGIEAVIHTNYGLRNIANRLRIGNRILSGGRCNVDHHLKSLYLDTLYRYEQMLCFGKLVSHAKIDMLMRSGPSSPHLI